MVIKKKQTNYIQSHTQKEPESHLNSYITQILNSDPRVF